MSVKAETLTNSPRTRLGMIGTIMVMEHNNNAILAVSLRCQEQGKQYRVGLCDADDAMHVPKAEM